MFADGPRARVPRKVREPNSTFRSLSFARPATGEKAQPESGSEDEHGEALPVHEYSPVLSREKSPTRSASTATPGSRTGDSEGSDDTPPQQVPAPVNPIPAARVERSLAVDRKAGRSRAGFSHKGQAPAVGGPRRRRASRVAATGLACSDEEEAMFMKVIELLEEQDEFAACGSDEASDDDGLDDDASVCSDASLGFESDDSHEDAPTNKDRQRQLDSWGPLESWELAAAVMDLKRRRLPNPDTTARIIRDVTRLYQSSPTVVVIDRPPFDTRLVVVGDLHGHFGDLMHILEEHGDPDPGPGGTMYMFNGDFVDRGMWGPEVLLLIYSLKLQYPTAVFLNRGNHEDKQQNELADNGFRDQHCNRAWKTDGGGMYALCRMSFKQLPLMHVVGGDIAIMHGGLPLDRKVTLQEINSIDRKHRVPIHMCNVLGYPKNQPVKAKCELEFGEDGEIPAGSIGRIVKRVRRSCCALVRFADGQEAEVDIAGAPELEEDVEILFDSKKAQQKLRLQRIFVALLWSDPVQKGRNGPSKRGVGWYFDESVTKDFLQTNGLSGIIRSHEKRSMGYCQEHMGHGTVIAATVFSASNYPAGAGEPVGNAAAVIVLTLSPEVPRVSLPQQAPSWRETYNTMSRYETGARGSFFGKLAHAEADHEMEAPSEDTENTRVRAIKKLRNMIYCARPHLLTFWNRVDDGCTGWVTSAEWASAMRACIVPDEDFPWEWLMPHLVHCDEFGNCQYALFLNRFENALLRRLAHRWHGGAVTQLAPGVKTREDAELFWDRIDRDGNGKLTYQELRPVMRAENVTDAVAEDDRVYSVLQCLDRDRSGYVDKEEFINAVVRANQRECLYDAAQPLRRTEGRASTMTRQTSPYAKSYATVSRLSHRASAQALRPLRGRASQMLDDTLQESGDTSISQCWLATQKALRALSAARCSVDSVFAVLDADDDGKIDRNEFKEGLLQLIHDPVLTAGLSAWEPLLWKLVDEDDSGSVSHTELAHLLSVRDLVSM